MMDAQTVMARYWINQPSTVQRLHKYHGLHVLAPEKLDRLVVTVYPTSGSTISMTVPKIVLAKGWRTYDHNK